MTIIYGLTSTGFVTKPLTAIRSDLDNAQRTSFGQSIPLGDTSLFGQVDGIMASRFAELWSQVQAVFAAMDPDSATGTALDAICALSGVVRLIAQSSTVTLTLTGTPATVVPSTSRVASTSTPANLFATSAGGTIAALSAWTANTAFTPARAGTTVGARVTNGGNCYELTLAGTSAPSGGPTGTGSAITDGSCIWRFLGSGSGAIDVAAQSVATGPVVGVSGDLSTISTPVAGWSGVVNMLDAQPGRNTETDAALRTRRSLTLAQPGSSTAPAIQAKLVQVTGVTSATVFTNNTDATNAAGMPPHSVECLVIGGQDSAVYAAVFANVAGGIQIYGQQSSTVTDSQGTVQTVKFTRPTTVLIYVTATVSYDATRFPTDGVSQVQQAIAAYGNTQVTGRSVYASQLEQAIFKVAGIIDVPSVLIGTAPGPTSSTTIVIASRQLAQFDTSRITVIASPGTP